MEISWFYLLFVGVLPGFVALYLLFVIFEGVKNVASIVFLLVIEPFS
jgi:hypothetical protein